VADIYDDSSIETMDQLELLRFRPTYGAGSIDIQGQLHTLNELISNSLDEIRLKEFGIIKIWLFINKITKTYQLAISDDGRGVPLSKLLACFTVPNTSGKYKDDAYQGISGGLYGIGAKVVVATSKRFRAITYRLKTTGGKGGYGSVTTNGTTIVENTIDRNNIPHSSGTLIVYEPDSSIFTELDKFILEGPQLIIEAMQRNHIFMENISFIFSINNKFIDEKYWTSDIQTALDIFTKCTEKSEVIYDSNDWSDPLVYLSQVWELNSPINWISDKIVQSIVTKDDKLGYDIRLYLPRKIERFGIIALINGVHISRIDSSHIQGLYQVLKTIFSEKIIDKDIKEFFLTKYKLPICIAMNIHYKGAAFEGTTKYNFKDNAFFKLFVTSLMYNIKTNYLDTLELCWKYLYPHIEEEYNRFTNKPVKMESSKSLLLSLNYPSKFVDCDSTNRSLCELFIVEGDSANNAKHCRDPEYQAVITTRGKPFNSIIDSHSRKISLHKLMKDKIWQDIVKVIGIQPGNDNQDLKTLNFGKIIIMHDADPDGSHIETIWISNFFILNPNIVNNGLIYIAKPPLYSIYNKDKKDKKIYMHNLSALMDVRILMYKKVFDIHLKYLINNSIKHLTDEEFRSFCYVICDIGEKIRVLSETLNIPDFILECLLHVINVLDTNDNNINIGILREVLPFDRIDYNHISNLLIISIGLNDYTISLNGFVDIIKSEIYPILQNVGWGDFRIYVSTKLTDNMKNEEVSFVKMYRLFSSINETYLTTRYKGIGKMSDNDLWTTSMDPNTRALYHIHSIGDVERIYALLGTDTSEKKNLLIDNLSEEI